MEKLYKDRDWLWEHYIARKESAPVMAKEAKCVSSTIRVWLHKYGIPVRNRGEGRFLAIRNFVNITPGLLEFMRGEILGDGHVGMPGNRSAHYSHSSAHEKYLIWLSERCNEWGIEQVGQIKGYRDKKTGIIYYHYVSKSYPELVPIRQRWYSERDGKMKKTVPKDLKLTPIMARQWYLGDGGLTNYKVKRPGIVFATCDFDQQSIEHLIVELQGQGFKATHWPSSNLIYISVYSVKDFLAWIGPCPISCYNYKWDYGK